MPRLSRRPRWLAMNTNPASLLASTMPCRQTLPCAAAVPARLASVHNANAPAMALRNILDMQPPFEDHSVFLGEPDGLVHRYVAPALGDELVGEIEIFAARRLFGLGV